LPPLAARLRDRLLGRQPQLAPAPTIERLRSRKAEVSDQLEQFRASTRFEPAPEMVVEPEPLETPPGPAPPPQAPAPSLGPEQKGEESYTKRLLKAKREVWGKREKDEGMKDEG